MGIGGVRNFGGKVKDVIIADQSLINNSKGIRWRILVVWSVSLFAEAFMLRAGLSMMAAITTCNAVPIGRLLEETKVL